MDETKTRHTEIISKIKEMFSSKNHGNTIVILGIIGLILIAVSGFFKPHSKPTVNASASVETRQQKLQQSLESIISGVEGAGKAKVLVTFENSAETVYATEEKKKQRSMRR